MEQEIDKIIEFVGDEFTETRNLILEEFEKIDEKIDSLRAQRLRTVVEDALGPLKYDLICQLGEGAKGVVYQVKHKETNQVFAMKTISSSRKMLNAELADEISVMFKVKHENIVKLEDVIISNDEVSLVMECAAGDLNVTIQTEKYDEEQVKSWLRELLGAVAYLHDHDIIHRDVKPENILLDNNRRLMLADFGAVKRIFSNCNWTPQVVTLQFRAPEILLGSPVYGIGVDIWSIGCVFFEMVEKKSLFGSSIEKDAEMSIILEIFSKLGTPKQGNSLFSLPDFPRDSFQFPEPSMITSKLDEVGNDLMMKMLELDPEKRISAREALNHPYLSDLTMGMQQLDLLNHPGE